MKVTARKVALVAVSAVLAACSVETGEVNVAVTCADEGCGKEGVLRTSIEDCDENTMSYGADKARVVLTSASSISFHFENVLDGKRCVQAFLDVDTSGNISAGDVISSRGIHEGVDEDRDDEDNDNDDAPEIDVEVEEDETVSVDVSLDTVVPAEF